MGSNDLNVVTSSPGNLLLYFTLKLPYKQLFICILTQKTCWSLLKRCILEELSKWQNPGKSPPPQKNGVNIWEWANFSAFMKVLNLHFPLPPILLLGPVEAQSTSLGPVEVKLWILNRW